MEGRSWSAKTEVPPAVVAVAMASSEAVAALAEERAAVMVASAVDAVDSVAVAMTATCREVVGSVAAAMAASVDVGVMVASVAVEREEVAVGIRCK
jgi:hypothetical protein